MYDPNNDEEAEAHDAFVQKAQVEAPGIIDKQLKAIKKPADWFKCKFSAGFSADEMLQLAISQSNDDAGDAYAEFIVDATQEARDKMLKAMATHFASIYAYEIYKEYCDELAS